MLAITHRHHAVHSNYSAYQSHSWNVHFKQESHWRRKSTLIYFSWCGKTTCAPNCCWFTLHTLQRSVKSNIKTQSTNNGLDEGLTALLKYCPAKQTVVSLRRTFWCLTAAAQPTVWKSLIFFKANGLEEQLITADSNLQNILTLVYMSECMRDTRSWPAKSALLGMLKP